MKQLSFLLGLCGLLTVVAVLCLALVFLVEGGAEGMVGVVFVLIVFGLPAVGFCILMLIAAGVVAAPGFARRSAKDQQEIRDTQSVRVSPQLGRLLFWGSRGLYALVCLYSVPLGFLTFVTLITGDAQVWWYLTAGFFLPGYCSGSVSPSSVWATPAPGRVHRTTLLYGRLDRALKKSGAALGTGKAGRFFSLSR